MVKCGKIYFDVFPAFTLMGQLQVALKSEWREIDSMLVGQGNVPTLIPCITEIPVDGCEVFSFGDSRFKSNSSYSPLNQPCCKNLIVKPLRGQSNVCFDFKFFLCFYGIQYIFDTMQKKLYNWFFNYGPCRCCIIFASSI